MFLTKYIRQSVETTIVSIISILSITTTLFITWHEKLSIIFSNISTFWDKNQEFICVLLAFGLTVLGITTLVYIGLLYDETTENKHFN